MRIFWLTIFWILLFALASRELFVRNLLPQNQLDQVLTDSVTQLGQLSSNSNSIPTSTDANLAKMTQDGEVADFHHSVFSNDIFTSGNSQLNAIPSFVAYSDSLAAYMKINTTAKLKILSHCNAQECPGGGDVYRSNNRAKSVIAYLKEKGIDEARMSYQGLGEKEPREKGDDQQAMKRNRRIEILID